VFYPAPLPAPNKLPPTDLTAHVIEGPLVKLGYLAASPVLKGDAVLADLGGYVAAIAAAYTTWLGATSSGAAPNAIANGAFITALATATTDLGASLAGWPSLKTLTE